MERSTASLIMLGDNKFQLYHYKSEKELERIVIHHSAEIFGENTFYLDLKKKITSISGISGIPDGFLIDFENNKFYIIEIELSTHEIVGHISNQLIRFKAAMTNINVRAQLARDAYERILEENPGLNGKIDLKGMS